MSIKLEVVTRVHVEFTVPHDYLSQPFRDFLNVYSYHTTQLHGSEGVIFNGVLDQAKLDTLRIMCLAANPEKGSQ